MMRGDGIQKPLSANDLGLTGAHQAGILVPKQPDILGFFPALDRSQLNPRCSIRVVDERGEAWTFVFIFYNNALVANGTRNEYRLTHMTRFLRQQGAQPGDTLCLSKLEGHVRARVIRGSPQPADEDVVIRHSGKWRVVRYSS
jgi:hypothetical protein